jgi:chaperonin cofactor prefoldin
MLRVGIAVVALLFSAGYALASNCPKDMAKIDAAMKTAQLSPADKSKVETYRKEGEALHKAGKHQEAVDTLAEAMEILEIK